MYHPNIEKQTDLFKLSVKLTDAKLTIHLQNYTDWYKYEG
jgi:hypothetical protein